ncbi:MAG: OsmC family protein [Acidimicrobiia bacterium]|nr:OsmC family protein [Acidimicrobiia bacterium]
MPKISIEWDRDWRFDAYDSKNMPVDIDGRQQAGVKPSDLLPIALAACSGTDLVQVLGAQMTSLGIEASFTQQTEAPWGFQRIKLHYTISGSGLTEPAVAEAIRKSEHEMCSVAASISVPVESTFEIVPSPDK